MNLLQLTLPAHLASRLTDASLVAVCMDSDAISYLQAHAWADFHQAIASDSRPPFSASDLLDIYCLLPGDEVMNVVMSPRQCLLLADYTGYYFRLAVRQGNQALASLYGDFLDELLPGTLISFQL